MSSKLSSVDLQGIRNKITFTSILALLMAKISEPVFSGQNLLHLSHLDPLINMLQVDIWFSIHFFKKIPTYPMTFLFRSEAKQDSLLSGSSTVVPGFRALALFPMLDLEHFEL